MEREREVRILELPQERFLLIQQVFTKYLLPPDIGPEGCPASDLEITPHLFFPFKPKVRIAKSEMSCNTTFTPLYYMAMFNCSPEFNLVSTGFPTTTCLHLLCAAFNHFLSVNRPGRGQIPKEGPQGSWSRKGE